MIPWIVGLAVVVVVLAALAGVRLSAAHRSAQLRREGHAIGAHELKGRDVMTIADARRIGKVDGVLFDRDWTRIVAFRVRRRLSSHRMTVARDDVTAVGPDAIMVPAPDLLDNTARRDELAHTVKLDKVHHIRVVTKGGRELGKVGGLEVDRDARYVTSYVLRGSFRQRLRHRSPAIPVRQVVHLGDRGLMVVEDEAAAVLGEARTS